MTKDIDYNKAVYRRNNDGSPALWYGKVHGAMSISIYYGKLGKIITNEIINTSPRKAEDELKSRYKAKGKSGYMLLNDVNDQTILPVEEYHVIAFLEAYLPYDRSNANGALLPMLAKLFDNANNKLFKDDKWWEAQPKINGLRSLIGATTVGADMFKPIRLIFQSREGIYWDSLEALEEKLLKIIPPSMLIEMLDDKILLDGELYIPGEPVNLINSFVKNTREVGNRYIQFWCYDVAIPNMSQTKRLEYLDDYLGDYEYLGKSLSEHRLMLNPFVLVPTFECDSYDLATFYRDSFIEQGFEGVILRDPNGEYQHGKRNLTMIKYKAITDGKFTILDIVPEGDKRSEIPLLVCANDINDSRFSVHIGGSFDYQKDILVNRDKYIGRRVFITYGERSGVNQVPFHVKEVTLIE